MWWHCEWKRRMLFKFLTSTDRNGLLVPRPLIKNVRNKDGINKQFTFTGILAKFTKDNFFRIKSAIEKFVFNNKIAIFCMLYALFVVTFGFFTQIARKDYGWKIINMEAFFAFPIGYIEGLRWWWGLKTHFKNVFKGHICSREIKWNTFWQWSIW